MLVVQHLFLWILNVFWLLTQIKISWVGVTFYILTNLNQKHESMMGYRIMSYSQETL